MGVRIEIVAAGRSGARTTVTVGRRGKVRILVEGSPAAPARLRPPEGVAITPEMLDEAVRVFLAQGDARRLGSALAEVYRAMERVRLAGGTLDG